MALSCLHSSTHSSSPTLSLPKLLHSHHHHSSSSSSSSPNTLSFPIKPTTHNLPCTPITSATGKWRTSVSFFPAFLNKKPRDAKPIKDELLEAIEPLDRGADATTEDQQSIDQIARKLEAVNPTKEPLKSDTEWKMGTHIHNFSINFANPETETSEIEDKLPSNQCGHTKISKHEIMAILQPGLIPIKAPGRARGELEINYLDEELRVSRGDKGDLFILKMVDPFYRVPV